MAHPKGESGSDAVRLSVFGRLAGYEDVNDAERLRHDPAMRWIVGGKAAQRSAASPSQMGRFETQWLAVPKNFAALADLSGQWIDLVHGRRPPRGSGQHLASILQEGWENANIHAGLGFIWRISAK